MIDSVFAPLKKENEGSTFDLRNQSSVRGKNLIAV